MARILSAAQKKVLNRYIEASHIDELPADVVTTIYNLRDYETLHDDVTRYLTDQRLEVLYGKQ